MMVTECCSLIAVSFVVEHLPVMPIMPVKLGSWQAGRPMHRPVGYGAQNRRTAEMSAAVYQSGWRNLVGPRTSVKACCPSGAAGTEMGGAVNSTETSAQCHDCYKLTLVATFLRTQSLPGALKVVLERSLAAARWRYRQRSTLSQHGLAALWPH